MTIAGALQSPAGGNLATLPYIPSSDDPDLWARVRMIARVIPSDVDLDDLDDVVRSLFACHFSWEDFEDALDDAIAEAKLMRDTK